MALNCGYPLGGRLPIQLTGFSFGKSCTKLVKHMALNCGYPLRGMFINSIDGF